MLFKERREKLIKLLEVKQDNYSKLTSTLEKIQIDISEITGAIKLLNELIKEEEEEKEKQPKTIKGIERKKI